MKIKATADGSIMFVLDGGETQDINGIGTVKAGENGSNISIGATADSNRTQISFNNQAEIDDANDRMTVITDGEINDYEFNGNNFDAKIRTEDASVRANTENSDFSSNKAVTINFLEQANNNTANLNANGSTVLDNGDNNLTVAKGQTNFMTGAESENAVAILGAGDDNVMLKGQGAFVSTGAGNDIVATTESAKHNVITTGAGNDVVHEGGENNIVSTGSGQDAAYVTSQNSLVELGSGKDEMHVAGNNNKVYGDYAPTADITDKIDRVSWLESFLENSKAYNWVSEFTQILFNNTERPKEETPIEEASAEEETDQAFSEIDTNQDGVISEEEMAAYQAG